MSDGRQPRKLIAIKVWDAPTRLFHWLLVLLVATSWLSVRNNWMQLHFLSGYSLLGLLVFRILWGFLGSETARFATFLKPPRQAVRHLAHLFVREPDRAVGHNAAGGWMVMGLLTLLAVQIATGFSANDDIMLEGPLAKYIGKELSDQLTAVHALNFKLIQIAALAHVCAVLAYAVFKRQDLVRPMVTGWKHLPPETRAPATARPLLMGLAVASAAILAALAVNLL